MTRREALVAAAGGVAAFLLLPGRLAREGVPVEVDEPLPPTPSPTIPPPPPGLSGPGFWISSAELASLRAHGSAWRTVLAVAEGELGSADVADQDSRHDVKTLACALAAAKTGRADLRAKALDALSSAVGTEAGARWLAIGRNLGAYVIAADVLDVRSGPVHDWLSGFLTRRLRNNNDPDVQQTLHQAAWNSGSNGSAQEGFVQAALAAYLGSARELDWGWRGFRRYCGDRTVAWHMTSNSDVWQAIPSDPVGIQDKGAVKDGCRLDGAISNDMSRGGDDICSPGYTQYPWVGVEGVVPAALVFARAGYPAWEIVDDAIRRAFDYLWLLRQTSGNVDWFDGDRSNECVFLVNRAYATTFPCSLPVGEGRTFGFSDWTHEPEGAALRRGG